MENVTARVETVYTSQDFGRYHVEPLPSGFGLTIGNALRRVLLSSLPGAAVTAMKVDGIYHEFATIPGVREDTTELILNIKKLRLKCFSEQPTTLRLQAQGPGVVTAADLICPADVEIANPELHLATLDDADSRLDLELTVERGQGYVPADGREPSAIGVIPVDAIFTPIRRVNYQVENTRVGSRTDFDRLVLEIQTDGTITPTEALAQAAQILINHFSIFGDLTPDGRRAEKATLGTGTVPAKIYDMPIEQLDLSARTYNCLKRSQITKIGQILQMSEDELLSLRNFGQKSLTELRQRLASLGLVQGEAARAEGSAEREVAMARDSDEDEFDSAEFDDDLDGDFDDDER